MPSASPSYHPAQVAVYGNVFELRMAPVSTYLYVDAFNELNAVFDEMIKSNLDIVLPDSSAIIDLQLSTSMSSQGLKRRVLREENAIGFQDVDEEDEEIFDILRNDDYENDAGEIEIESRSESVEIEVEIEVISLMPGACGPSVVVRPCRGREDVGERDGGE